LACQQHTKNVLVRQFIFLWTSPILTEGEFNTVENILKVFLHPPPPPERESFIKIFESRIPKSTILSIEEPDCEDYLLRIAI